MTDHKEQLWGLDTLVVQTIEKLGPKGEDVPVASATAELNKIYMRHGYGGFGTPLPPFTHQVFGDDLVRSVADRCMGTGYDPDLDIVFIA